MKDSQVRELDAAQRVREFVNAHKADFPNGSRAAAVITTLENSITQVQKQASAQDAASLDRQEATEQKQAAIESLVAQMRAINSTARSIDSTFPGMADQFKMVRGNGDQAILNRARAYITEATPIKERFTDRSLPASFLDDLQTAIDAVEEADNHQSAALIAQTAATAGVAAALKQMRAAMKEFQAIARNTYRSDPETFAAFKSASRVESAAKKAKPSVPLSS